ncbi:hypothetical protein [Peijinzhouia sedimentorum]
MGKGENEDFLISAFFKPLKRFVTRGVFYPTVETMGYGWVLSKGVEFDYAMNWETKDRSNHLLAN